MRRRDLLRNSKDPAVRPRRASPCPLNGEWQHLTVLLLFMLCNIQVVHFLTPSSNQIQRQYRLVLVSCASLTHGSLISCRADAEFCTKKKREKSKNKIAYLTRCAGRSQLRFTASPKNLGRADFSHFSERRALDPWERQRPSA